MQSAFDFGDGGPSRGDELRALYDLLLGHFGPFPDGQRRSPTGQMVKSLISSRTKDPVSLAAYNRLVARYPDWSEMAAAPVEEIEALIAEVEFPDKKARQLLDTLRLIAAHHPDYDLGFLGEIPVDQAIAWLERLPGVGLKVAASALNFSTLNRPAFVVDTHMLRLFDRIGFTGRNPSTQIVYDAVMTAVPQWSAEELGEFHSLLKVLGQTLCPHELSQAQCGRCPLASRCATGRKRTPPKAA